jgi:hypothetical protein
MSEQKFSVGDVVTYETLDVEYYSRGYGINMESKASTIVSICYKLANGEIVEGTKLVLVQSKSDQTKTS